MLIQKQYNKLISLEIKIAAGATMFCTIEETKETALDFSQGIVKLI